MLEIRVVFILAALILVQPIFSQCNDATLGTSIIARKKGYEPYSRSDREDEMKNIIATKECLSSDIESRTKARMSFLISNRYFYMDSFDLASQYLQYSIALDSTWFCKNLDYHYTRIECNEYVQENIGNFFMMDMVEIDNYLKRCKTDTFSLKEKAVAIQLKNSQKNIPEYLREIFEKDQVERLKDTVNWEYQKILDEENRENIDHLLLDNKLEFTNESLDIVWFIVQHSTDCKWTMKWFEILLKKVESNQFDGDYMKFTFERFFDTNNGYCFEKCELDTKIYLKKIRDGFGNNQKILDIISD